MYRIKLLIWIVLICRIRFLWTDIIKVSIAGLKSPSPFIPAWKYRSQNEVHSFVLYMIVLWVKLQQDSIVKILRFPRTLKSWFYTPPCQYAALDTRRAVKGQFGIANSRRKNWDFWISPHLKVGVKLGCLRSESYWDLTLFEIGIFLRIILGIPGPPFQCPTSECYVSGFWATCYESWLQLRAATESRSRPWLPS